ncbi:12764_t:CDS:2 [Cetraspora pellucida]|uniref:12764_t:CDS:1 n=1 Tax=Cetraspora pellucida TaxID=1433469 RepID=A0ACA9JW12_9GLOM|nr:12764_t:CDS:2 [Cetraspora pellucida]
MGNLSKLIQKGDLISLRTYFATVSFEESRKVINSPDAHSDTLIHFAARFHKLDILSFLVQDMGGNAIAVNEHGRQPLHEAIDSLDCVKFLCEQNVDVNCMKRGDWTPIMIAAMKGRLDIVKVLVDHGANVNFQNKDGWNCLHFAAKEGHLDIVIFLHSISPSQSLIPSKSGRLPIHTAALCNHPKIVFYLLSSVSSQKDLLGLLSSVDNSGTSLLQNAVVSGNLLMVKKLIQEYRCSITHKDKLGRQVIHNASMIGDLNMIKLLVEAGCNVNEKDEWDGWTSLHHACKEGHINVVNYLVTECDVNVVLRDKHSRFALEIGML